MVAGTNSVVLQEDMVIFTVLYSLSWVWLWFWGFFFESWRLGKIVNHTQFLVFSFVSLTHVLIKQGLFLLVLDITSCIFYEESLSCVCLFPTKFQLEQVFLYTQAFNRSCWLKTADCGRFTWAQGSCQEGTIQCLRECSESYWGLIKNIKISSCCQTMQSRT